MKSMSKLIRCFLELFGVFKEPLDPVEWCFTLEKEKEHSYNVHITGFIESPWRLCAQHSSENGPLPTRIRFKEHSDIMLVGTVKEMGDLKEEFDYTFQANTHYYTTSVHFVQKVMVFSPPVMLQGRVIYMAYTNREYADPKILEFQLEIHEG